MQKVAVLLSVLLSLFSPVAAEADDAAALLKVKFDCYFTGGSVDCQTLRTAYFASMTFLEASEQDPGLNIEIRTLGSDDRTVRYILKFDGAGKAPDLTLIDDVPTNLSTNAMMLRVLADLQKCTAPYLAMLEPGVTESDRTIRMRFGLPRQGGGPAAPDETSGWYQSSSIFGHINSGDNTVVMGNFGTSVNYSDPSWRLKGSASANYQRITVKLGEKEETQEVMSISGKTMIVRTVHGGWSVAAVAGVEHSPASNLDHDVGAGVGVSWDLVPFLTTYDHSFGFLYVIGPAHQNYVEPNVLGKDSHTFFKHGFLVYFNWHFNRIDINAGVGGDSIVDNFLFSSIGGNVGITWRITDRLQTMLGFNASYRRGIINQPAEKDVEDPLEQYLRGGNFSKVTLGTMLSVGYTFGNSAIERRDQRWKNF